MITPNAVWQANDLTWISTHIVRGDCKLCFGLNFRKPNPKADIANMKTFPISCSCPLLEINRNDCCFQWLRFGMICYAQKLIQALNVSFSIQKDEVNLLFLKAQSSTCFFPIPACMLSDLNHSNYFSILIFSSYCCLFTSFHNI